jgi:hypothetical protein
LISARSTPTTVLPSLRSGMVRTNERTPSTLRLIGV